MKLQLAALCAAAALSAQNQPVLGEDTVKVSQHVWAIMGFPNIAIVVGNRATLVVDTGLGPRNGATIARVAAKLAPSNQKLFLTTTHFHPEHAAGEAGFPKGTILIRNSVQQQEMEAHGQEVVDQFAARSAEWKELLTNTTLRTPDVIFDADAKVDLGGVTARLLWFGDYRPKMGGCQALAQDREAMGRLKRETTRARQEIFDQEASVCAKRESVQSKVCRSGRSRAPATIAFPAFHPTERYEAE